LQHVRNFSIEVDKIYVLWQMASIASDEGADAYILK